MGAEFNSMTMQGILKPNEVRKQFDEVQERAGYECGHGGYTGSWYEASGISFPSAPVFSSEDEACNWLQDNAQKWEAALAVRAKQVETSLVKAPTFTGADDYDVQRAIRNKSPFVESYRNKSIIPADALTDNQKSQLIKAVEAANEAERMKRAQESVFFDLKHNLNDLSQDFTDYAALKKARATTKKATEKAAKAKSKLDELGQKLSEKLYKEETSETGEIWVIGAWCSS